MVFRACLVLTPLLVGLGCGSNPADPVADADTPRTDVADDAGDDRDVPPEDPDVPDASDIPDDTDAPDDDTLDTDAPDTDAPDTHASDTDADPPDSDVDTPPPAEDCTNGVDDDGDGAIDGADAECEDVRACSIPAYGCEAGDWSCNVTGGAGPDCDNGLDDDADGLADCEDPDCAADPPCRPLPCLPGECADGETCERYTGTCIPAGSPAPIGADIGEPCAENADCRTDGHVRGPPWGDVCESDWPGGYCMGGCSLCEDTWAGVQLPRRECPSGSVCLPADQFNQSGTGACVQECQTDDDCRTTDDWESYFCRRTFWVDGEMREFTNGYCAPPHCSSRGCTGYVCGC